MVALAGGSMPGGGKPMKPSSIALMGIAGVIGGTWMVFRLMAQRRGTTVTTSEELNAFRGSNSLQTDAGGKTARSSHTAYPPPRGGSI